MRSGTVLVVIGVMFVLSVGPGWLLFAAIDLKLFEKVGLAPEYTPFEAGPTIIAAAMNKSIDVAIVKAAPFLEGLSQGVDWVMIGIYS